MGRLPDSARVALTIAAVIPIALAAHRLENRAIEQQIRWDAVDETAYAPSPLVARLMAIGYNELVADLAWARLLVYYGGGMVGESSMRDVEPLVAAINRLDPKFYKPYIWGAYAVTYRNQTATQKEFQSSVDILQRGAEAFPDKWELLWLLGIRYAYDLKTDDPELRETYNQKAADAFERAMRIPGAPGNLPLQLASLRTKLGQNERALQELREMIQFTEDEEARFQLLTRYEALLNEPGAGAAIEEASVRFRDRWKADKPYVPETLYVLIGEDSDTVSTTDSLTDWERVDELVVIPDDP